VGGGTNNAVWLQATSDIGEFAQALREKTIGASYGDAFLAALGVGDVKLADINSWNKASRYIEPNTVLKPLYDKQYAAFRALYERNRDLMREG